MKNFTIVSLTLGLLAGLAHADTPKADKAAPKAPDKAPEMPKAPQELADMAKGMAGSWTCTGKADMGGTMNDVKGTVTHKLDMGGWWIVTSIDATMGKMPALHMQFMTTYDAGSKKYYRATANSMGGHGTHWGTGDGKKMSFEGESHGMAGDTKTKNAEEVVSAKEVHLTGQYSKDGGKTWVPDHDITCKK